MIQDVQRIEQQPTQRRELHPAVPMALGSDIAKAIKVSVAGSVLAGTVGVFQGWDAGTIGKAVLLVLTIALVIFVLPDVLHILKRNVNAFGALIQAIAEMWTGRDLNHSGRVGDVVTHTEYRIIPSNIKANGIPVQMGKDTVQVRVADLKMVVLDGDLLRAHWLGEKDANPVEPFKSQQNARLYYDAVMKILDDGKLTKRGENNSRKLIASPTVTWQSLQLD